MAHLLFAELSEHNPRQRGLSGSPPQHRASFGAHSAAPALAVRELLGKLSRAAWETAHELIAEAGGVRLLPSAAERRRLRRAWAQMIRRIYEVDPLTCRCGAQMRILSFILDPRVVTKILRHIADEKASSRERARPASALAS